MGAPQWPSVSHTPVRHWAALEQAPSLGTPHFESALHTPERQLELVVQAWLFAVPQRLSPVSQ